MRHAGGLRERQTDQGLALQARRLRTRVERPFHGWIFLVALGAVSAALALCANGRLVAACAIFLLVIPLSWLGGIWVRPGSDDAYARRFRNIVRNSASGVAHGAKGTRPDELLTASKKLDRLRPPVRWQDHHQKYRHTFDDYVSAVHTYYQAIHIGDSDQIRDAAVIEQTSRGLLDQRTSRYLRELGEWYTGAPATVHE